MAVAVFEAALGCAPDVIASMSFVVALLSHGFNLSLALATPLRRG